MSKTADRLILRPVSQHSPGSVSTGETPRQKMSKAVASRDTKPDSGRGLTKSNLSSVPGSSEKETRRLLGLKLDNHRISLDRKSGRAFSDPEIFTKGHALDFHSGKTVDQPIPSRKSEDSPRSASVARGLRKKGGRNFFLATRECLSGVLCSFD